VEVVASEHPWLRPGDRGTLHRQHPAARFWLLRVERASGAQVSVQLVPGRDRVRVIEADDA